MKTTVTSTETLIRCRAEITFTNGMKRTATSPWHDQRNGFDGGHWGIYPSLASEVEAEIRGMQKDYGAPSATVEYHWEQKQLVTQVIETNKSNLHCAREIEASK